MNISTSGVQVETPEIFVTSFEDGLQPNTPAPGWAFLWNQNGAIGEPDNYISLQPAEDEPYYDQNGIVGLPDSDPGAYVYFAKDIFFSGEEPPKNTFGGHPGLGYGQNDLERFAIAAYTVDAPGEFAIHDGLLRNTDNSDDGIHLQIYVNSTLKFDDSTAAGYNQQQKFNINLGDLKADDTIYVAVGAGNSDLFDTFALQYSIVLISPDQTFTGTAAEDVINGQEGNDTISGFGGDDVLVGGIGKDLIRGGNGEDILIGHTGNDNLMGDRNDDILQGGAGADRLTGGTGNDILLGGTESDSFVFNSSNEGIDLITDFMTEDDTILISSKGFDGGLLKGELDPFLFVIGTQATSESERFIYNSNNGKLFFDADGNGSQTKIQIATLNDSPMLTAADFLIV